MGFPKKLARPSLRTEIDMLVGTLDYGPVRVATGTMAYNHRQADLSAIKTTLSAPNFLLRIIPHVDGTARICELVEYYLEDITIKGAWIGRGALSLSAHAMAPVAELPVLRSSPRCTYSPISLWDLARSCTIISRPVLRSRSAPCGRAPS